MTSNKRMALVTAMVVVIVAIVGTVAFAMYDGIQAGHKAHGNGVGGGSSQVQVGTLPAGLTAGTTNTAGTGSSVPSGAAILQPYPYPGGGPFQPGPPPFAQPGASGDGLSSWGVAFKETTDSNAQPDAALIASAFQDAQKKAQALASAAGLKLGKLVAITDYAQADPYYGKPCIQPELGVQGGAASGATGTATIIPVGPPVPAPSPCQPQRFLVVWVLARYQIQG